MFRTYSLCVFIGGDRRRSRVSGVAITTILCDERIGEDEFCRLMFAKEVQTS